MKKWILMLLVVVFSTTTFAKTQIPARDHQTIIIFRHGEKPKLDFGQLKCQGLNRALALPNRLLKKYGKPNYLFAPNPYWGGYFYYPRALNTIEPLAIREDMPVNHQFYYSSVELAAEAVLASAYHQSLIFMAWEHVNIPRLSKKIMDRLGGDEKLIPSWSHNDFDSIFVFDIYWQGKPQVSFRVEHENLNGLPTECPTGAPNQELGLGHKEAFVFIPEAETSSVLPHQLSCQGLNRSLMLPRTLNILYPKIDRFVLPKPRNDKSSYFLSSLMTIEPTIISRGGHYIPGDFEGLASMVKMLRQLTGFNETTVITWPIATLADLAQSLYADFDGNPADIPSPLTDHNLIYEIDIAHRGLALIPSFIMHSEQINNPASICPGG